MGYHLQLSEKDMAELQAELWPRNRAESVPFLTTSFRVLKLAQKSCRPVRKKHGKRALAFHAKFTERKSRMTQCHLQLSEKDMTELRTELTEEATDQSADRVDSAEDRRSGPEDPLAKMKRVLDEVHLLLGMSLDGIVDYLS